MKNLIILGVVALFVILFGVGKYNTLVTSNNAIDAQWAQVDSVLQRRFDAINQAVGGIKAANKSEQDALQKITDARKIYVTQDGNTEGQVAEANNLTTALNGFIMMRGMRGEAYPDLKTPGLVGGLIDGVKIEGNENRINVERQRYNEMVETYNSTVLTFPSNMIAKIFGFGKRSYFKLVNSEAEQAPQIAPNVDF